jgi:hypothetical protein
MATVRKVIRLANPRRRKMNHAKRRRNRRMTAKQIKFFGSARQRAALKRHRTNKRRKTNPVARRPKVKVIYRTPKKRNVRKRRRRSNPALVVTLGSINPRRRTKVAKTRRRRRRATNHRRTRRTNVHRVTRRRRRTNRRRNPRKVYVMNPPRRRRVKRYRRHNAHRRRHMNRRRNPAIFGRSSAKDLLVMVGGGLVGVTATKLITAQANSMFSSTLSSLGTGGFTSVLISGVSAFLAGWAGRMVSREFGDAVLFGGLMQTGSVAVNAFLPSSISGQFSLGDLVNGNFVVPQNPIRAYQMAQAAQAAAAAAPVKPGMGAAYPSAY